MLKFILFALLAVLINAASTSIKGTDESVVPLDGRIVGGKETSVVKHPHQISFRCKDYDDSQHSHRCGGSIYNATTVITAAHCVINRDVSKCMVVAGSDNRRGSDGVIVPVLKTVMHEKYNASIYDNDVAILFLALELPLNNLTIAPIKLSSKHPDNGVKVVVTGWGATTQGGSSSDFLLEVEVPIVSNDLCKRAYSDIPRFEVTDAMMCAGSSLGGKDACQGDSGGPLVHESELIGIVSWGEGCAQAKYPGVYASVPYLKDWIEKTIMSGGPPAPEELRIDFL